METRQYLTARWWLRGAAELGAVTLLVFGTGWVGVRVAEWMHRHPVHPGRGGVIELRLAKSDRHGDVSFEEGSGYAGWWHCRGRDWSVEWGFKPEPNRRYNVEVRLASLVPLDGESIKVDVGDHQLQAVVPEAGRGANWKTLSLGELSLEGVPCSLSVHPGSPGLTNLNVKSVTLRPVETAL